MLPEWDIDIDSVMVRLGLGTGVESGSSAGGIYIAARGKAVAG